MNFKLPLIVIFSLISYLGFSQIPENIIAPNLGRIQDAGFRAGCSEQFAGTITFDPANFIGQSNDVQNETKYFCFGDVYNIIHNGDADLTGDPESITDPGIGYAWFNCKPTATGPDLATILADGCVFDDPAPANDIWVYTDDINGDARFSNQRDINDGMGLITMPEFANNGDPIEIWFAPITFDALSGTVAVYEGNPSGPCVNVNVDQAFSVVYLNEIIASNRMTTNTGGSFDINGGLSEWDNSNYTIDILFLGNPAITGTVTSGAASHGDAITYTVPRTGTYRVTISDGKSCIEQFDARISDGNPLFVFEAGDEFVDQGDIVCVPIITNMGFDDLLSFQFGINYDDTKFQFESINGINVATNKIFSNDNGGGVISTSLVLNTPITIFDGDVIFEICFTAIGDPNECSDITFTDLPSTSPIEVVQSYAGGGTQSFGGDFVELQSGSMCINPEGFHEVLTSVAGNCGTASSGQFTVNVFEGTPPYSFSWQACSGGTIVGPLPVLTDGGSTTQQNLAAGDYCYTIVDSSVPSGQITGSVTLVDGPNVGAQMLFTSPSCAGASDGEVCVGVSENGTQLTNPELDYSFSWSNTDDMICTSNVPAGSYGVTVTHDDSGCSDVALGSLTEPPGMIVDNVNLTNPSCPENNDGSIAVTISGGQMPYQFNWEGGATGAVRGSLLAGQYIVSITDGDNCQEIVDTFNLVDPTPIIADFSNMTAVSCFNGIPCDGGATVMVSGGTVGVYEITWESGEVTSGVTTYTATQLCQGFQSVTISDGICAIIDSVEILAPSELTVDMANTMSVQASCFEAQDGSVTVAAMGGDAPYNYSWNLNGSTATGPTVTGLGAGSYQVFITDDMGCSSVTSVVVGQPDTLIAFIDLPHTSDVSCGGDADGQISVAWSGGNSGLATYSIGGTPPSNVSVFTGLTPGDYTITVTDVKGCTDEASYTVLEPQPVIADIMTPEEPQCAGYRTLIEILDASGGTDGIYTYSVDNGPKLDINTPIPVFAGQHTIIVYDENGCSFETMITINEPQPTSVTVPDEMILELGEDGTILANFISGYDLDTVTWTPTDYLTCPGDTTGVVDCLNPMISPLETTLYTVTTTDLNGCIATAEILVKVDKDRNVFIPNVFTPNADGTNDVFGPIVANGVTNVNFMQIYDRWGELVYQVDEFLPLNTFSKAWDGSFKGQPAETGVYVYLIEVEFLDGVVLLYRGDVTLLSREK